MRKAIIGNSVCNGQWNQRSRTNRPPPPPPLPHPPCYDCKRASSLGSTFLRDDEYTAILCGKSTARGLFELNECVEVWRLNKCSVEGEGGNVSNVVKRVPFKEEECTLRWTLSCGIRRQGDNVILFSRIRLL